MAALTLVTGPLSEAKLFSQMTAAISAARPQRRGLSSTTTARPVRVTEAQIVSASSGAMVRTSITSAETPSSASCSAAARARSVHSPTATRLTSSPGRTQAAFPSATS